MAAITRPTRRWGFIMALAIGVVTALAVLSGGGSEPVTVATGRPAPDDAKPLSPPGAASAAAPQPGPAIDEPRRGEDTSPGRYRETPDAANFVVHPQQPASPEGLAMTQVNGAERLRFSVHVAGHDGTGSVRAQLTNVSGREMRFVDGLRVVAEVTRDGRPWREFVLVDRAVTALAPGSEASVQTSFPFDGSGQYASWASVEIELV